MRASPIQEPRQLSLFESGLPSRVGGTGIRNLESIDKIQIAVRYITTGPAENLVARVRSAIKELGYEINTPISDVVVGKAIGEIIQTQGYSEYRSAVRVLGKAEINYNKKKPGDVMNLVKEFVVGRIKAGETSVAEKCWSDWSLGSERAEMSSCPTKFCEVPEFKIAMKA